MKNKNNTEYKLRHELKHYISYHDYLELLPRLRAVMSHDKSTSDGSYRVRSLYFDNYNDKVLREKIDGAPEREKFRLRFYNKNTNIINMEKKSKTHGLCKKDSAPLSAKECEILLTGDFRFLKDSESSLLLELYAKMRAQILRPKSIVDYHRDAYVYPPGNVRITVDSDIRYSGNTSEFLLEHPTLFRATPSIILEVKYDEFLPQIIADTVGLNNRFVTAFSKYASARMAVQ